MNLPMAGTRKDRAEKWGDRRKQKTGRKLRPRCPPEGLTLDCVQFATSWSLGNNHFAKEKFGLELDQFRFNK